MIKTTGAEFNRFYNDPAIWDDDKFHEGEIITLNGVELEEGDPTLGEFNDIDAIMIDGGVVYADPDANVELGSFESFFKKWRKQQSCAFLSVEVPKDKADAVISAIKAAGGRVIK